MKAPLKTPMDETAAVRMYERQRRLLNRFSFCKDTLLQLLFLSPKKALGRCTSRRTHLEKLHRLRGK